jgi:hypothetical protein
MSLIGAGAKAAAAHASGRTSGLDVSSLVGPWGEIRGAAHGFLTASVDHKSSKLLVEELSPEGGFDSILAACSKDTAQCKVLYGAFPFQSKGLQRFAFFTFIGKDVGGMAKGRVSLQKAGVYAAFEGVSADLTFNGLEELTRENVTQALQRLPGVEGLVL